MKLKALVFAGALLVAGVASAQEPYITNSFKSNLFVGLSGGVNTSVDGVFSAIRGDGDVTFGTPGLGLELSLGKWFTPDFDSVLTLQALE